MGYKALTSSLPHRPRRYPELRTGQVGASRKTVNLDLELPIAYGIPRFRL